jgi:hypothetical protein
MQGFPAAKQGWNPLLTQMSKRFGPKAELQMFFQRSWKTEKLYSG